MQKIIKCKHFNGLVNDKCDAGILYDEIDHDQCVRRYDREVSNQRPCAMKEYPTQEELDQQERETEAWIKSVGKARRAITDHMQGKAGTGLINCPVCETGKLSFAVYNNGHIHARCSTEHCVAWME